MPLKIQSILFTCTKKATQWNNKSFNKTILYYSENQFFITLTCDSEVSNRIGEALYNRIVLASKYVLILFS
jgi:hypothetical protein